MKTMRRESVAVRMLLLVGLQTAGQEISGTVVGAKSKEPLMGVIIEIAGDKSTGVTGMGGRPRLTRLEE